MTRRSWYILGGGALLVAALLLRGRALGGRSGIAPLPDEVAATSPRSAANPSSSAGAASDTLRPPVSTSGESLAVAPDSLRAPPRPAPPPPDTPDRDPTGVMRGRGRGSLLGRSTGAGLPDVPVRTYWSDDMDRLTSTAAPDIGAGSTKPPESGFTVVPVYFGTDRSVTGLRDPASFFGRTRGSKLTVGRVDVSIPRRHRPGELEAPSWKRMEFKKDQSRHIVLVNLAALDSAAWTAEYGTALRESSSRQALVFVHGYNVSFENAAMRTAQLAFDLGIDGPAAFFSWPSRGAFQFYAADEAAVERSVPFLAQFMNNYVIRSDPARLNVIAHSMGNRALSAFLREVHGGRAKPRISNVILAAPDIDAEVFEKQIAPIIAASARRVTLYASSDDRALLASSKIHSYRRAGESGDSIVVIAGVETIDASGVDTDLLGHGYFAQNKAVLDDLFMLLKHDLPARSRNLRERKKGETPFWAFLRP